METHDRLEEWANARLADSDLPSGWPDEDGARKRLEQRIAGRRPHRIVLWMTAAAAVCAALLIVPQSRAVAQRLWDQVFLGRLQVLITSFDEGADVGLFSPDVQHTPEPR